MVTSMELMMSGDWESARTEVQKVPGLQGALVKNIGNLPAFSDDFDKLGPDKVAGAISKFGPEMTTALNKGDINAFKGILKKYELEGMPDEPVVDHAATANAEHGAIDVMSCHSSEAPDGQDVDAEIAAAAAVNEAVAAAEAEQTADPGSITNGLVNAADSIAGPEVASAVNTACQSGQGLFAEVMGMFGSGKFDMSSVMNSVMGLVTAVMGIFTSFTESMGNGEFKLDGLGDGFRALASSMGANPSVDNTSPAPATPAATADQTLQQTQQPATPGITS